jgi:uncharacterized protein (TIGR02757 family)
LRYIATGEGHVIHQKYVSFFYGIMISVSAHKQLKHRLDKLYHQYNHREYVHPDPLEFLYRFPDIRDREIVGLIGASLAYGKVAQILKSVSFVLEILGKHPSATLRYGTFEDIKSRLAAFVHRFATAEHMTALLMGIKGLLKEYGSLGECFGAGMGEKDETVINGLSFFISRLLQHCPSDPGHLIANPEKTSACKRLHLFLRWMTRNDAVDPGGWESICTPSQLIVPLDTHMYRICSEIEMTCRRQPDIKTAFEVTNAFKRLVPHDPVRYDFSLTRLGIRSELKIESFLGRKPL